MPGGEYATGVAQTVLLHSMIASVASKLSLCRGHCAAGGADISNEVQARFRSGGGVKAIFPGDDGFAAVCADNSVVYWGNEKGLLVTACGL